MITSLQNDKVKALIRLRERRERDRTGLFLIEGYREIVRAQEAGRTLTQLFVCSKFFLGANEDALIARAQGEVIPCTPEVFAKISYRDRPDGLLAVSPQVHLSLHDLPLREPAFFCIAERIEKPGNLGTILRSADAAGVHGLILCDPTTDLHNPNVVRASVGTLFTLPIAEASAEETAAFLHDHKIRILAATPSATLDYTRADLTQPVALLVGAEQYGLTDLWLQRADLQVKIPMCGKADSLNVGVAAALLFYEVVRQRG